jgi:hypothetical protein
MTGFNLPPGVNVSDIPGNRPEDLEEETFWEALDEKFLEGNFNEETLEKREEVLRLTEDNHFLQEYVNMARDMGYSKGYEEGQHDADMAARYECDHKWRDYGSVVCRDCGVEAPEEIAREVRNDSD